MNSVGGHVEIDTCFFTNINTCGSLVRNKDIYRYQNTGLARNSYANWYRYAGMNYQYSIYSQIYTYTGSFSSCSYTTSGTPCFSLKVLSSTFTYFGQMKIQTSSAVWVDSAYKMKYYGSVIDL